MARRSLQDKWFWLTECTKTVDEQDPANPFKPFPPDEYLRLYLEVLDYEKELFIEKSRTMMCSWATSAHCAHLMFTYPAIKIVIQSRDEDRAVHDITYIKQLWDNSIDPLKKRWKLARPLEKQPYYSMEMANGSCALGITGDPDKIRSEHPTIVVLDEAAYIESDANYNVAIATRCKQIIALSSAKAGWFREYTEFAQPVEWPDYTVRKRIFQ
jgi:hypothetical protein